MRKKRFWTRVRQMVSVFTVLITLAVSALSQAQGLPNEAAMLQGILWILFFLGLSMVLDISQQLQNIHDKVDDLSPALKRELASRFPMKYLVGKTEIIEEINRLQERDLKDHLRVVIYETPKSPDEITDKLIHLLKERADIGTDMTTVMFLDYETVSKDFVDRVDERLAIYKRERLTERVHFKAKNVRPPIGVDVYIIDEKHVILNLTDPGRVEDSFYRAVLIENEPEVARAYVHWFEKDVVTKTDTYEEFKAKIRK